jgi:hypothetical protein
MGEEQEDYFKRSGASAITRRWGHQKQEGIHQLQREQPAEPG